MKIYIAGQITGNPCYRQEFAACERRLASLGFSVMNPAWLCEYPEFRRDDYLAVSRSMLGRCDAIFLLPYWESSAGAKSEKAWAEKKGLKVFDGNTGEAGAWAEVLAVADDERRAREEREGKTLRDALIGWIQDAIAESNSPACKERRRREIAGAIDAYGRIYDFLTEEK